MLAELKCKICGKEILIKPSRLPKAQYCSIECKAKGQSKQVERKCFTCGKIFSIPQNRVKNKNYCSLKCSYKGKSQKIERKCKHCGKTFFVPPSRLKEGYGIYCSRQCIADAKKNRVTRVCPVCGKIFTTAKCYIERGQMTHCSMKCRGIDRRGPKSSGWKGGLSYGKYCSKFNNEFKERVRKFFDYKCQSCGSPENGRKLSVHHVNYDKRVCCNDGIPLFIPLCQKCHLKTNHNRDYWEETLTNYVMIYFDGYSF